MIYERYCNRLSLGSVFIVSGDTVKTLTPAPCLPSAMSCVLMSGSGQAQPIRAGGWWVLTNERRALLIPGVVVASSTLEMGHTERWLLLVMCCVLCCCWPRPGHRCCCRLMVLSVPSDPPSCQHHHSDHRVTHPNIVTWHEPLWRTWHVSRDTHVTRDTCQSCGRGEARTTHPDLTDPVWWAHRFLFISLIFDVLCVKSSTLVLKPRMAD